MQRAWVPVPQVPFSNMPSSNSEDKKNSFDFGSLKSHDNILTRDIGQENCLEGTKELNLPVSAPYFQGRRIFTSSLKSILCFSAVRFIVNITNDVFVAEVIFLEQQYCSRCWGQVRWAGEVSTLLQRFPSSALPLGLSGRPESCGCWGAAEADCGAGSRPGLCLPQHMTDSGGRAPAFVPGWCDDGPQPLYQARAQLLELC